MAFVRTLFGGARLLIGAAVVSSLFLSASCGGDSDDGVDHDAGPQDSGVTLDFPVIVPQCVSSAYDVVFRGVVEPMETILRYLDTPIGDRESTQLPPIPGLVEDMGVPNVYSRFTWSAGAVPGVVDPGDAEVRVDFGWDPLEAGNPALLDDGISFMEVVQVKWVLTEPGDVEVGSGRFSVVGLDEDVVRITIVAFNPTYEPDPCHFEIISFNLHLDLATEGSKPYAVVIGFEAEASGFEIENGAVVLGTGDEGSFTGSFVAPWLEDPMPFDLHVDFGEAPAILTGSIGERTLDCTIDLGTLQLAC